MRRWLNVLTFFLVESSTSMTTPTMPFYATWFDGVTCRLTGPKSMNRSEGWSEVMDLNDELVNSQLHQPLIIGI